MTNWPQPPHRSTNDVLRELRGGNWPTQPSPTTTAMIAELTGGGDRWPPRQATSTEMLREAEQGGGDEGRFTVFPVEGEQGTEVIITDKEARLSGLLYLTQENLTQGWPEDIWAEMDDSQFPNRIWFTAGLDPGNEYRIRLLSVTEGMEHWQDGEELFTFNFKCLAFRFDIPWDENPNPRMGGQPVIVTSRDGEFSSPMYRIESAPADQYSNPGGTWTSDTWTSLTPSRLEFPAQMRPWGGFTLELYTGIAPNGTLLANWFGYSDGYGIVPP